MSIHSTDSSRHGYRTELGLLQFGSNGSIICNVQITFTRTKSHHLYATFQRIRARAELKISLTVWEFCSVQYMHSPCRISVLYATSWVPHPPSNYKVLHPPAQFFQAYRMYVQNLEAWPSKHLWYLRIIVRDKCEK